LLALLAKLNADSHRPRHPGASAASETNPAGSHLRECFAAKGRRRISSVNVGKLMLGDETGFKPCTPAGIQELLVRSNVKTEGAEVVVLGRAILWSNRWPRCCVQKSKRANCYLLRFATRARAISNRIAFAPTF
jgi:methylenetetrahydrofolate dehydrogenase (NADP+)/methenyltetrahydrofolate cyclohydrolase